MPRPECARYSAFVLWVPLCPRSLGELQCYASALQGRGEQACGPQPSPPESLQREKSSGPERLGAELGAEASFLSLSCSWGLQQACHVPAALPALPPHPRDESDSSTSCSAPDWVGLGPG